MNQKGFIVPWQQEILLFKVSYRINFRVFLYERLAEPQRQKMYLRAVWSESSLGAFWIAKDVKFYHANN